MRFQRNGISGDHNISNINVFAAITKTQHCWCKITVTPVPLWLDKGLDRQSCTQTQKDRMNFWVYFSPWKQQLTKKQNITLQSPCIRSSESFNLITQQRWGTFKQTWMRRHSRKMNSATTLFLSNIIHTRYTLARGLEEPGIEPLTPLVSGRPALAPEPQPPIIYQFISPLVIQSDSRHLVNLSFFIM